MKWMFKLVFLSAVLWGGYWYFGARAQEKIYVDLLAQSRDQGWTAESQNLGVTGFPNRFDTTLRGLNFRDPSGRWGWRGEEFQIKALSYKPNHIIMAWPGQQVLETPEGDVTFSADLLRASLVVSPSTNLPLSRFQIEGENIDLDSSRLGAAAIGVLNGAIFQDADAPTSYRLGIELTDVEPPRALVARIGGSSIFGGPAERVKLDAIVEFDREIDRIAFQNGNPPRPISAKIELGRIVWGESVLKISGELADAGNGFIQGDLHIDVENWQPMFEVFKQASHLTTTEQLTLKRAIDGAASSGSLVFTVSFVDGESRIGPFTIGPAPRYPF